MRRQPLSLEPLQTEGRKSPTWIIMTLPNIVLPSSSLGTIHATGACLARVFTMERLIGAVIYFYFCSSPNITSNAISEGWKRKLLLQLREKEKEKKREGCQVDNDDDMCPPLIISIHLSFFFLHSVTEWKWNTAAFTVFLCFLYFLEMVPTVRFKDQYLAIAIPTTNGEGKRVCSANINTCVV